MNETEARIPRALNFAGHYLTFILLILSALILDGIFSIILGFQIFYYLIYGPLALFMSEQEAHNFIIYQMTSLFAIMQIPGFFLGIFLLIADERSSMRRLATTYLILTGLAFILLLIGLSSSGF